MTTIRVTAENNSDARDFWGRVFRGQGIATAKAKHNGGKTVIVTCEDQDLPSVVAALDSSRAVRSYDAPVQS